MRRAAIILTLAILPMLLVVDAAIAATCDVVELPGSGTLTAERFNQRYRQVEACINGKIGNANWSASEPLAVTNLQNQYAYWSMTWSIGDGTGPTVATSPTLTITIPDTTVADGKVDQAEWLVRTQTISATSTVTWGIDTGSDLRQWKVPAASTIIGWTAALRCTAACAGAALDITLQNDAATIAQFTGIASTTLQSDMAIVDSDAALSTADVVNIDISGTATNVIGADIAIFYKTKHAS